MISHKPARIINTIHPLFRRQRWDTKTREGIILSNPNQEPAFYFLILQDDTRQYYKAVHITLT